MKKISVLFFVKFILGLILILNSSTVVFSQNYLEYSAKVIDQNTQKGIPFSSVVVIGSGIATVSNNEGEFILKVPNQLAQNKVQVSCLGYRSESFIFQSFFDKQIKEIVLTPSVINFQELIIRADDPKGLIKKAIDRIPQNYGTTPYNAFVFYRESIKQNKKYAAIGEAVMQLNKSAYNSGASDLLKMYKGRKSEDFKRMDTIIFKLKGGQHASLLLDVAKNVPPFLSEDMMNYFDYSPVKITTIQDREAYLIEFKQKENVLEPFFDGSVYLDIQTLAIIKSSFEFGPVALNFADRVLISKKPIGVTAKPIFANYSVEYQLLNNRWVLNFIHYEIQIKVDKKRKLFSKTYTSSVDFVVTEIDTLNVQRFKYSESVDRNDVFIENVSLHYDEGFWGNQNIIKPEESIEDAIERINKKIKK